MERVDNCVINSLGSMSLMQDKEPIHLNRKRQVLLATNNKQLRKLLKTSRTIQMKGKPQFIKANANIHNTQLENYDQFQVSMSGDMLQGKKLMISNMNSNIKIQKQKDKSIKFNEQMNKSAVNGEQQSKQRRGSQTPQPVLNISQPQTINEVVTTEPSEGRSSQHHRTHTQHDNNKQNWSQNEIKEQSQTIESNKPSRKSNKTKTQSMPSQKPPQPESNSIFQKMQKNAPPKANHKPTTLATESGMINNGFIGNLEQNIVGKKKKRNKNQQIKNQMLKEEHADQSTGFIEWRKLLPNENYKSINQSTENLDLNQSPLIQKIKQIQKKRVVHQFKEKSDANNEHLQQLLEMLEKNKKCKEEIFSDDENNTDQRQSKKSKNQSAEFSPNKINLDSNVSQSQSILMQTSVPQKLGKLINQQQEQILTKSITNHNYKKYSERMLLNNQYKQQSEISQTNLAILLQNTKSPRKEQKDESPFKAEVQGKAISSPEKDNLSISKSIDDNSKILQQESKQSYIIQPQYSQSPRFLAQNQSNTQLEMQQMNQDHQVSVFKQLINQNPSIMNDFPKLSEEAKQILSNEYMIDVLTIEIPQNIFENSYKDQLVSIFGSQILKVSYKEQLQNMQQEPNYQTEISNPYSQSFLQLMEEEGKRKNTDIEHHNQSQNVFNFKQNQDIHDIIHINAIDNKKVFGNISIATNSKQISLQKAWGILFPSKQKQQCDISNVNVIIKYSLFYQALKQKYNLSKKNRGLQYCFVATRDSSIIEFLIYVHKNQLIQNASTLLGNVSNLVLVIKMEDNHIISKINLNKKSFGILRLDGTYLRQKGQSPKMVKLKKESTQPNLNDSQQTDRQGSQSTNVSISNQINQKRANSSVNMFGPEVNSIRLSKDGSVQQLSNLKKEQKEQIRPIKQTRMVDLNEEDTLIYNSEVKESEQAKIKIWHQGYDHLKNSPINKAFRIYNEFLSLTFKNKNSVLDQMRIMKLGRYIGVNFQSRSQITENFFRNKETGLPVKEKLYMFLVNVLNQENDLPFSNRIDVQEQGQTFQNQNPSYYKYFIGEGNNSLMVRNIIKQRWWWYLNKQEKLDFSELNFIWTQWRKNKILQNMNKYSEIVEEKQDSNFQSSKNNSFSFGSIQTFGASQSLKNLKAEGNNQINTQKIQRKSGDLPQLAPTQDNPNNKISLLKMYNKLEDNFHLSNKKALFLNMKNYYEAINQDMADALPMTFHIKSLEDPEFHKFQAHYLQIQNEESSGNNNKTSQNIWIIKPGENTNRGCGIEVRKELSEISQLVEQYQAKSRTIIIQKYISNPLLISKRKFDIRCYLLITSIKGQIKAYFYREGYLRTSCKEFSLANLNNRMIHLTNDAVQKFSDDYGKFEPGNKLSYEDFQRFLNNNYAHLKIDFYRDILPQIQKIITDTVRGTFQKLDPNKRINSFEIFGYDFMIDDTFKVYLIEANTNPCLELSSPLLAKLIPQMVDNSFRIALDPLFPPPENFVWKKAMMGEICSDNKFELIFDERVDSAQLLDVLKQKENIIIEIDEEEEEQEQDEMVGIDENIQQT